ncbi:hypothetical protein KP509_16G059300 [Ceratopteris richardii]|uniref:Uncharacterized protein n=1 Tax=Ceratopteris richardii TaxID=49495 RepID=A0A8T2SZ81_CERRI|nr:hypothetical protein KP509_16G059300 [Ceratopteris richardii]
MFYSQFILAKKGPLATIWIAAHLERKLRKNQITDTNIGESVDSILYPEIPIALRLSGHLLLGVVRIYSRKVNLLFNDCSEALLKLHQAFQSSTVNLPPGAAVAPFNSITLPESFDFDDMEVHFSRDNVASRLGTRSDFEYHVTARDLITLQEQNDDRRSLFSLDERFEDPGNPYAVLDLSLEELAYEKPLQSTVLENTERITVEDDMLPPLPMEEEIHIDGMDIDKDKESSTNLSELHAEEVAKGVSPIFEVTMEVPDVERLRAASTPGPKEYLMELDDVEMPREASSLMDIDSNDRVPITPNISDVALTPKMEQTPYFREDPISLRPRRSSTRTPAVIPEENDILGSILGKRTPKLEVAPTPMSISRGVKKRKIAFDVAMQLSSAEMKKQLKSTNEIRRTRRRAPSTEFEIWMSKRDNHIEQNFLQPSLPVLSEDLKSIYEEIINGKVVVHSKPQPPLPSSDSVTTRRTPRRLSTDVQEEIDCSRKIIAEPIIEEELPQTSPRDETISNMQDVESSAVDRELILPVCELETMDNKNFLDIVRVPDEENYYQEPLDTTVVKDMEGQKVSPAYVENNVDVEASTTQGLGFLADSRYSDETGDDKSASTQFVESLSSESGWSSRSRAVAMYLKDRFETTEVVGGKDQNRNLTLEKLLSGRSRREAARLFFETLVLGTKGYLQVEQTDPYTEVQLIATQRLLKAAF